MHFSPAHLVASAGIRESGAPKFKKGGGGGMPWYYWLGVAMIAIPLAALIIGMCIYWPWVTLLFAWGIVAIVLIERSQSN